MYWQLKVVILKTFPSSSGGTWWRKKAIRRNKQVNWRVSLLAPKLPWDYGPRNYISRDLKVPSVHYKFSTAVYRSNQAKNYVWTSVLVCTFILHLSACFCIIPCICVGFCYTYPYPNHHTHPTKVLCAFCAFQTTINKKSTICIDSTITIHVEPIWHECWIKVLSMYYISP